MRLRVLGMACQGAYADLGNAWRDRRLGDDLPALVLANVDQIPPEALAALRKAVAETRTGFFDSHPADADRVVASRALKADGLFRLEGPASVLFADFPALCRSVSLAYYREVLETDIHQGNLVDTAELVKTQTAEMESRKALARMFQNCLTGFRLPSLGNEPIEPADAAAAEPALRKARARMESLFESAKARIKDLETAEDRDAAVTHAFTLRGAGLRLSPGSFGLARTEEIDLLSMRTTAQRTRAEATGALGAFDSAAAVRLRCALSLRAAADPAAGEEINRLAACLGTVEGVWETFQELRGHTAAMSVLCSNIDGNENNSSLAAAIHGAADRLHDCLGRLHGELQAAPYPFDHAQKDVTIAGYAIFGIPATEELGALYSAADEALDRIMGLRLRCLARLAQMAEQAETDLGLPPLADPEPDATPDENKPE
jgi:hypothetical protein